MYNTGVALLFAVTLFFFVPVLLLEKHQARQKFKHNRSNKTTNRQVLIRTTEKEEPFTRQHYGNEKPPLPPKSNENGIHHREEEEDTKLTTITLGGIAFDQGQNGDKGEYVCVTMDWWPANKCNYGVCPWKNASILTTNLTSLKLQGLLKQFGGIILRIGGTQADTIVYEEEEQNESTYYEDDARARSDNTNTIYGVEKTNKARLASTSTTTTPCLPFTPSEDQGTSEFFRDGCLTRHRWKEIVRFANKTNTKLIFGINAMFGRRIINHNDHPNGTHPKRSWSSWHPHNAKALLEMVRDENLQDQIIGFEFGNELNVLWDKITAEEQAMGFHQLHQTLLEVFGSKQRKAFRLLGPDYSPWNTPYYSKFIPLVQDIVWGITWHEYPLGAGYQNPHLEKNIMDPTFLDTFGDTVAKSMSDMNQRYAPPNHPMKLIMGETGGAYNSGNANANNRFMDAFWYLHAMGRLAQNNHSMFCRQALVGGNYELIDKETHLPNPSYYAALLFKRVMGRQVRNVSLSGGVSNRTSLGDMLNNSLRVFAHCNLQEERLGLLVINYMSRQTDSTHKVSGNRQNHGDTGTTFVFNNYGMSDLVPRDEYAITAPSISSRTILLNNNLLPVGDDGYVDTRPHQVTNPKEYITVTAQSYTFVKFAKESTISQKECGHHA